MSSTNRLVPDEPGRQFPFYVPTLESTGRGLRIAVITMVCSAACSLIGMVMLVAEVKITSYGLLALGGIVCLTLGGLMLFQSPDPTTRVSPFLVLPTVLTLAAITLFLVYRVVRSRAIPVATGTQGLIGWIGEAATDLNPQGFVFIHGENWMARSATPIPGGAKVRVVRVEGLTLEVEPVEHDPQAPKGV